MTDALARTFTPPVVDDDREALVRVVALALHRAGAPAHRLEATVSALADRLDLEARVFSTPTAVYASFGPVDAARTTLLRAAPAGLDLARLADVDTITRDVLSGDLHAIEATRRLEARFSAPPAHGTLAVVPAFGITGAVAAVLLGGGAAEALAASLVSVLVGVAGPRLGRNPRMGTLSDLVQAMIASLSAGLFVRLVHPADAGLVTVAAIIALVPGLTLTTALTELASNHLVSGTARLAGAATTFAKLGLGALAGTMLLAPWPAPAAPEPAVAAWVPWLLLPVAGVTFTVLLQARWRDLPSIVLTSFVGFAVVNVSGWVVAAPLDATLGAMAVALVANGLARWLDTPSAVPLVPGLFLLVPGSTGFRGLTTLLDADLMAGMDQAVGALITAVALAAGILVAQAALPTRRAL